MRRLFVGIVCLLCLGIPLGASAQSKPRMFWLTDGVPVAHETRQSWEAKLTAGGYVLLPKTEVDAARAFLSNPGAAIDERVIESLQEDLTASGAIWISIRNNTTGLAVRVALSRPERDTTIRFATLDSAALELGVWKLVDELLREAPVDDREVSRAYPQPTEVEPIVLTQPVTTSMWPAKARATPDYHRMTLMGTIGSDGVGVGFNLRVNHGVSKRVLLGVDVGLNGADDGAMLMPIMATAEYRLRVRPRFELRPRAGVATHLLGTDSSLDLLVRGVIGITWVYSISESTSLVAGSDLMLDADQEGTFFIVNAGVGF